MVRIKPGTKQRRRWGVFLTDKHGWVVTGINPLTELREVISTEMLWDIAVNKAAANHTHHDVKVQRYNPQEITKQGIVMQQTLEL